MVRTSSRRTTAADNPTSQSSSTMSASPPTPPDAEGSSSSISAVAARQSRARNLGRRSESSHTDPDPSLPSPTAAGPPSPNPSPPDPTAAGSSPALHIFSENKELETLASKLIFSNDPVISLENWLNDSDNFNQSDIQHEDDNLDISFDFSPNMSQNIDVYEEDDNNGREEHYMTSTPLPTPPTTPEDFMHEDLLFEMAYNNNTAVCVTPTPPLEESHDQTIRHETDATTLYAPTPIQVKSCEFFF